VASATKLATARTIWGQSFDGTGDVSGAISYVEKVSFVGGWMEIGLVRNSSNDVQDLIIQANGGNPLSINPNGANVGIGTTDPQHKLHVVGDIATQKYLRVLAWEGYGNGSCDMWFDGTTSELKMGSRLHVAYDIRADGNIVANGTIACKGVAAEGSAPVGTVDKWAGSIATGTKSQTYTHGLGTTDITVAIYEKNGNEWVQILTDVDIVNANTIRVTFGANTTVEHRIVVMG
jgi:hypothetical protein